jgi:serine protease inhibitor
MGRTAPPTLAFGLRLARALAPGHGPNLFLSPASASLALAMAAAGAAGDTRAAMLDALGLAAPEDAAAALLPLTGRDGATVEIANALWARRGLELDPDYAGTIARVFRAEAGTLDFGSPAAARTINEWVARATHGRIGQVVDSLPAGTVLCLVNATYFHGDWARPFDPRETREGRFRRAGAADTRVPLMGRTGTFEYGEGPDFQAVALPYEGGALRMLVVLPRSVLAPAGLAALLDRFQEVGAALSPARKGSLSLPRFTIADDLSLAGPLAGLGMGPAFRPGADFSRLSPDCGRQCAISEVVQRTRLEVDERGTTAAAATAAVMVMSLRHDAAPFQMVVDRPFVLAIQAAESGELLFLGLIGDPPAG